MSGGRTAKGEAELQRCLIPLEVFEIEGSRIVRRSPRDLDIPCKQYPRALGQVGIYCWANKKAINAVSVDRFSAHLIDPAPAWLGIDHQPEWGMRAIKYAISDIERQTIERPSSSVIKSRDANDVVINAGGAHFQTEILYRRIFQGKRLGERGIGAGTLAKTRQRIALELIFSNLAYIGADGEAEQMLGVDRVGTCDDRPESNDGGDDQQHRLHDLGPRRFHCGSPDCLDVDRLGCDIFAPCDTSGGLARIGHARGDVESSIIPRESITASLAGRRRSKAAVPA